jgi:hypothetical protein
VESRCARDCFRWRSSLWALPGPYVSGREAFVVLVRSAGQQILWTYHWRRRGGQASAIPNAWQFQHLKNVRVGLPTVSTALSRGSPLNLWLRSSFHGHWFSSRTSQRLKAVEVFIQLRHVGIGLRRRGDRDPGRPIYLYIKKVRAAALLLLRLTTSYATRPLQLLTRRPRTNPAIARHTADRSRLRRREMDESERVRQDETCEHRGL